MKRTRLKITCATLLFCGYVVARSLELGHTDVTIIALGVISGSGLMYKYVETKRKSNDNEVPD